MAQREIMTQRARRMRREPTDAEHRLWLKLRAEQLGVKFRHQMPIGAYIVDFACVKHRLIVEVDGDQHADSPYDQERDRWLVGRGYRVLRFGNRQVLQEMEAVLGAIQQELAGVDRFPLLKGSPRGTKLALDSPTGS